MIRYIKILYHFLRKPFFAIASSFIVAVLCFIPNKEVPDITGDKTAHFIAFAGLGFLWFLCTKNKIYTFICLLLFGVFIEVGQYLLPESFYRFFELYDIFADLFGVLIGYILSRFYQIFTKIYFAEEQKLLKNKKAF